MMLQRMAHAAHTTLGLGVRTVRVTITYAWQLLWVVIGGGIASSLALWASKRWPLEPVLLAMAAATAVAVLYWAVRAASGRLPGLAVGVLIGVIAFAATYQPWALMAVPLLLWLLLIAVIGHHAPAQTTAWTSTNGPTNETAPDSLPSYPAQRPRYRAKDVIGMDALLAELSELARRNVRATGAETHNGILLYGDPGNGKTMYAHVVADLLRLPIIEAGLGTIKSQWINQSAIQITKLFADARHQAPCVLFLDEATSLLENRAGSTSMHEEDKKATDAFLQELDRVRGHGVVVIAACNHIDRLDPAAVRPGRFDDRKLIPNPDAAARAGLIEQAAQCARLQIDEREIAAVNAWWEGFSVALVRELARKAVELTRAQGQRVLTATALEHALKAQQGGESELRGQVPTLAELVQTPAVGQELHDLAQMLEHARTLLMHGGKVERGAVFAGPPGTGKTLSAQALAKTIGWNFVGTSGPDLLVHGRIDEVFAKASRLRPCVVLIDEAEAAIGHRGSGGMGDAVTAKMLTMLDGADNKAIGLFFVVCTNHPELLDSAVVRPGRLGRAITFEHADAQTAQALALAWAARKGAAIAVSGLGERLHGLSFAEITERLERAFSRALIKHGGARAPVIASTDL